MPDALAALSLPALAGLVFAFFGGLTAVNVAFGFAAERALPGRRVFAVPLPAGQLRHELVGNVVFVGVTTAAFTAALAAEIHRFGEETWLRAGLTFVALMFAFQAFYYWLHRAMHTKALLRFHRWHHTSQVTTALSAQSVSFVEAVGWMIGYVLIPAVLSWVFPISFWGYVGYMAFNVSGNVVGHANVELTARAGATRAATWFANPFVYHALHHARWTGHYSFQAALMDRLFSTEYADWPELYDRVASGRALATLRERGESFVTIDPHATPPAPGGR